MGKSVLSVSGHPGLNLSNCAMKYEEILGKIGGWGRYQKFVIFLLVLSTVPNGFFAMVSVFILDIPEHHCTISQGNESKEMLSPDEMEDLFNASIPYELNENGELERSRCLMYLSGENETTIIKCNSGWTFYPQYGEYTASMQWNLACDRLWMKPLIIALFMFGILVGSLISGALSDRFGRRPVFLWGTALQFISMGSLGFSTGPEMLAAFMFLSGCSALVNYVAAFVIVTELVECQKRALVGSLEIGGFSIGYMLLPAASYFLTNWRWLMWFMGAGGILFIPYYWLIPESPRWLIMNGKPEAKEVIRKIIRINGKTFSDEDQLKIEKDLYKCGTDVELGQKFTYLDLFKHPTLRLRSLVMFFIWFSTSMTYYCISLGTSNLGGNKFLNCFVAAGVEIPAYITSYFLMENFGRRVVLIAYLLLGGSACALAPAFFTVNKILPVVCSMLSKFCVTGVFSLIYIYCCEMFPTKMRNMSVGASSTMARVGAIIAPYLIHAGQSVSSSIPYVVMGGFGIVSALFSFFLPETLNIPLPETVDDAVTIRRTRKKVLKIFRDGELRNLPKVETAEGKSSAPSMPTKECLL